MGSSSVRDFALEPRQLFSCVAHDICRSSTWTTKRFGSWKQADFEDDDLADQAILDSRFVLMGRAIAA